MKKQEPQQSQETAPQSRSIDDIPPQEQARFVGDDEEAKDEVGEDTLSRAVTNNWRAAKALLSLREQINAKFPSRSKLSDGIVGDAAHRSRASDHNPWVVDGNVGIVTAMDITHDPGDGCDANAIAEAIRNSHDARVKYIIWNRRIANSASINGQAAWSWRSYTGKNPHDKHVHISVLPDKSKYDSTAAWNIDGTGA